MIFINHFYWYDNRIVLCRRLPLWWLFKVTTKFLTLTPWKGRYLCPLPLNMGVCAYVASKAQGKWCFKASKAVAEKPKQVPPGSPGMAMPILRCSSQNPRPMLWDSQATWKIISGLPSTSPTKIRFESFLGLFTEGFLDGWDCEESTCNEGDPGSSSGLGRSPGEGNVYPLQYSCLENPIDRRAWWATVHEVTKIWT